MMMAYQRFTGDEWSYMQSLWERHNDLVNKKTKTARRNEIMEKGIWVIKGYEYHPLTDFMPHPSNSGYCAGCGHTPLKHSITMEDRETGQRIVVGRTCAKAIYRGQVAKHPELANEIEFKRIEKEIKLKSQIDYLKETLEDESKADLLQRRKVSHSYNLKQSIEWAMSKMEQGSMLSGFYSKIKKEIERADNCFECANCIEQGRDDKNYVINVCSAGKKEGRITCHNMQGCEQLVLAKQGQ